MAQENTLGNPTKVLSINDIGGDLTTKEVRPETGLTEDSKSQKRLSIKDIEGGYGDSSSLVFPGSVQKSEKILGEGQFHPELDPTYQQQLLHERQTATGMMANSLGRFAIEVGSTALQTVAYDSDLTLGTDLAENTQQEFGNGLSRFAESMREFGAEKMPIYVDPYKAGKFDPGSLSWWAENAVSVGSSIGMVAPAMLLAAATGGAATAIGLGAIAETNAFRGITTALWSRHAENLMEASGVYKQAYDESRAKGLSDKDAKTLASLAASNTYKKQWALLAQDVPQYILLNKLGSALTGKKVAEKATEGLAPAVEKYLGYGSVATAAKRVGAVAWDMAGEGGEELYQAIVNEQSNLIAANAADPKHNVKHSMLDAVKNQYDQGDFWTAGFWGAAGAGMMQAGMHGLNYKVQQAVGKAQLDTVSNFGTQLKQASTEYGAALDSGDPVKAEEAVPTLIATVGLKAHLTNTVPALKKMLTEMKNAPEGQSFDKWGVDPTTQGRLKQDPAFFDQVMTGIDRMGELYGRFLKENKANKSIAEVDKEPNAQVMANSQYLIDSTKKNMAKVTAARDAAWAKIEHVEELSEPGRQAEILKQQKRSAEKMLKNFTDRQEKTTDKSSDLEKKQIEAVVEELGLTIAKLDNDIADVEKSRTAKEKKADAKIILPQDQIDEYVKQSGRLNAASASITQLTKRMEQLRAGTPLSTVRKSEIEQALKDSQPDKIDKDNSIQLEDTVEFEDPDTKEVITAKVEGIQEQDETNGTGDNVLIVQPIDKDGKPIGDQIAKPEGSLYKSEKLNNISTDEVFDGLSESEDNRINTFTEEELDAATSKVQFNSMNKLSYTQQNKITKVTSARNAKFSEVVSDKNTSFKGAMAFYSINHTDPSINNIIKYLVETGKYTNPENTFTIVVKESQQKVLAKILKTGLSKLTESDISTLIDTTNDFVDPVSKRTSRVFNSFVDIFPINIRASIQGVNYVDGLVLHGSSFVSVPNSVKRDGKTQEERNLNIAKYKLKKQLAGRKVRRDLLALVLQGKEVHSTKIDRGRGVPNTKDKLLKPEERNQRVDKVLGVKPNQVSLAITSSNKGAPEVTTMYQSKDNPIPGSARSMQGPGNIFATLVNETLNGDPYALKLNRPFINAEHAALLLDAFLLVGRAKVAYKDKKGKPLHAYAVRFTKELHSDIVEGITAGELIDLFVVNGREMTDPNDARFKQRYTNKAYADIMASKRLFLHIAAGKVILVYGTNKDGKPNTIDLLNNADVENSRQEFIDWMTTNKRYAVHLFNKSLQLNLNGDFLRERTFKITTVDKNGKKTIISRARTENYSTFVVKNGLVLTDTERDSKGNLFHDPVINLNLVNKYGNLNVIVKGETATETKNRVSTASVKEVQVEPAVTIDDVENKEDFTVSQNTEQKEETKKGSVAKESAYKNRFSDKKNRSSYSADTLDPNTDEWTSNSLIPNLSQSIEELIAEKKTLVEIKNELTISFENSNLVFGKGAKRNQAIFGYLEDRMSGKTNRTLLEEWNLGATKGDKTSSTATVDPRNASDEELSNMDENIPAQNVTLTEDATLAEEDMTLPEGSIPLEDILAGKKKPKKSLKQLKDEMNDIENEPPFAREVTKDVIEPYTKERMNKEMEWAFDAVGIPKEEWDVRNRFADLLYKGRKNYALYSHSAILLYEAAEIGTIYHEAFHRVSLGYLTKNERVQLYRAARNIYKLSEKEYTDRQVEDMLAEKFRVFILSKETKKVPGVIQRFFDMIIKGIKSIFYGKQSLNENDVDRLFRQIYAGKFKQSTILEENINSLGDEMYARTVLRNTLFNTLNNRQQFKTLTTTLAIKLLGLNKVEDLNNVDQIRYQPLVSYLEGYIDDLTDIVNDTEETPEEERTTAAYLRDLYKEMLGTKDETSGLYDTFSRVTRPAIDSFLLGIGIKQIGITESDLADSEDDIEMIGRLGGDYLKSSYERNKRDTALPNIKFMIATLHKNSYLDSNGTRVFEEDQLTGLTPPIEFRKVWSKLQNDLYSFDDVNDMIEELKYLAEEQSYSPYSELADRLEKASQNTKNQFFVTLRSNKNDFINLSYYKTRSGIKFNTNRSAFKDAYMSDVSEWNERFFNDDNISRELKERLIGGTKKDEIFYSRRFDKRFFDRVKNDYNTTLDKLANVIKGLPNITESKREQYILDKVNDYIHSTQMMLSDFNIEVGDEVIRHLINKVNGENITNDLERLYTYLDTKLKGLIIDSPAATAAFDETRLDRSIHSLFKVAAVFDIARADIELHPEKQNDMQIGPGNGDTKKNHLYSTFSEYCHATETTSWINNKPGYVEERLSRLYTKRSRILRSMVPVDNSEEARIVAENNRTKFGLKTFSYLQEEGRGDKGRGYLNITALEDYLIKYAAMFNRDENDQLDSLLPLPVMASRKTYFFMSGVQSFQKTVTGFKGKTMTFSKEVLDYFYDAYLDENERTIEARRLLKEYETATGDAKEAIKNTLVKNYHYTGNFDTSKANAIELIRFRGFPVSESPNKAEIQTKISALLNKRVTQELEYASSIGVISYDIKDKSYDINLLDPNHIKAYESEHNDTDLGVRGAISDFAINYMMSVVESEKIFMADPAFFSKNRNTGEIVEDLYKRWFGVGSTGENYAQTTDEDQNTFYNALTLNTQTFVYKYHQELVDRHTELWTKYFTEHNKANLTQEQIADKASKLAKDSLVGYTKVDATDGGALISPSMYKKMLQRSGAWNNPRLQKAFELMNSDEEMTPEEEIKVMNIILNPQKTVYFGNHGENGLDAIVYDKMSMGILFKRIVKGTHMEDLLNRMELTGKYANVEGLEKIDVANYDSAIKIGAGRGYDLFTNKQTRDQVNDLSAVTTSVRYWKNLRKQQTTDAHDVTEKQLVGTQVFKIATANIIKNEPYGKFTNGTELLNALTKSRMAVSNMGRHKVESELGIQNGVISNKSLIRMLKRDALKANKSEDFRAALKLDKDGKMYLELDSFPDRRWVYSRLMGLVTSNTVDLGLPGAQLIQSSDYGFSDKIYNKELEFTRLEKDGKVTYDMEAKVSVRMFKRLIPGYEHMTHAERVAALPEFIRVMGYRIPTQGQNSVVNLKIVQFLPDEAGEVIHLPLEFTTLTGSDFDIDKLFIMMHNYEIVNKKLQEVQFTEEADEQSTQGRYNSKIKELYKIYKKDDTVFTTEVRNEIGKYERTREDVRSLQAIDRIKRNNIEQNLENTRKYYAAATDEYSKKALEDQIILEESMLDEFDNDNFMEDLKAETWSKISPIVEKTLIKAGKIGSIKDFSQLSIEEQNTGAANENRMLDIFHTVISDVKHFTSSSLPLGTLTDELKARANRYEQEMRGKNAKKLDALESETPMYQSQTKFKFMTSTKGIGPFALSNAHHSLTQMAALKMRTRFDYGINQNRTVPLDLIVGRDLKYVTDWLSAMIDAHVDAVKDNYITSLNVNESTYGVTALMLRLGFGIQTFDFLAQPVLREYAKEFFNLGGGKHVISEEVEDDGTTSEKAYKIVKRRILKSLDRPYDSPEDLKINLKEEDLYIPFADILKDEKVLIKDLNPDMANNYEKKIRQLNVLEYFMRISKDADKLNKLVLASRVDTKAFGNTPTEFRFFLNKLREIEDKGSFPGMERLINTEGTYVDNGTMLSPLLKNSILYLEDIFKNKSIYGATGFNNMFWRVLDSIPGSANFRISSINTITEEMFGYFAGQFFGDQQYGIGMTKERLRSLLVDGNASVFATLSKVKSKKFKYYESLKDNKFLSLLNIDSKQNLPLETFLRTPFFTLSDNWETDDYIEDFMALINHEDPTVRMLGRQLYLYAYYSTGFRHRYYDYLGYMPTTVNKEMNMVSTKDKSKVPVSFNKFVSRMLVDLNDPSSMVEHFTKMKKDIFQNNWFNSYFVPSADYLVSGDDFRYDKNGDIAFIEIPIEDNTKHVLGVNEDGNTIYSNYVTLDNVAKYKVPVSTLIDDSGDEDAMLPEDPNKILGSDTGLYEFIGINQETENPLYRPVNKKGFSGRGVTMREFGIADEESFMESNNLVTQRTLEQTLQLIREQVPQFNYIPLDKQQVVSRAAVQSSDFATNMAVDMMEEEKEKARARKANIPERSWKVRKIISGLQTGVDTLGLKIAKKLGYLTGGRTTKDYGQERSAEGTFQSNEELAKEFGVKAVSPAETNEWLDDIAMMKDVKTKAEKSYYLSRTYWNVKNADATVYFAADYDNMIGGSATRTASRLYLKKFFLFVPLEDIQKGWINERTDQIVFSTPEELRYLLKKYDVDTLNIAGSSASKLTTAQTSFFTDFMEEALQPETNASNEKSEKILRRVETANSNPDSISTPDNPLNVFIDGSVTIDANKEITDYGYGASMEFNGKDYSISGTMEDVDKEFFDKFPTVRLQGQFSPSMELFALVKTLEQFQNTSEHLSIRADNDGNVSYLGLWDRVSPSDPGRPEVAKKPQQPHIKYLVNKAVELIKKIEDNGGTVSIGWVPGHLRGNKAKLDDFIAKSAAKKRMVSNSYIDFIIKGNDKADLLSKNKTRINTFKTLVQNMTPTAELNASVKNDAFKVQPIDIEQGENKEENCKTAE